MNTHHRFAYLATLAVVMIFSIGSAQARPDSRVSEIPSGDRLGCGLCHVGAGGGPPNPFGAMAQTFHDGTGSWWGPTLANLDSDEDGYINGRELGDDNGVWTPGDPQPEVYPSFPGDPSSNPESTPTPTPTPMDDAFHLEPVATGLTQPARMTLDPKDSSLIYVATRIGQVYCYTSPTTRTLVLSLGNKIKTTDPGGDQELGFCGLAIHPTENFIYVSYSGQPGSGPDDNTPLIIEEYPYAEGTRLVDSSAGRIIMNIQRPPKSIYQGQNGNGFNAHFSGNMILTLKPQGLEMKIAVGDGGTSLAKGSSDPLSIWYRSVSQNPRNLMGKVLRIVVNDRGSAQPYSIPEDNPYVSITPPQGMTFRKEIIMIGVRNPWGFNQDPITGSFVIPQSGQDTYEYVHMFSEHSWAPGKALNGGWNIVEGNIEEGENHCVNLDIPWGGAQPKPNWTCEFPDADVYGFPTIENRAVLQYVHGDMAQYAPGLPIGESAAGAIFYNGDKIPPWSGSIVAADFNTNRVFLRSRIGGPTIQVMDLGRHLPRQTVAPIGMTVDRDGYPLVLAYGHYLNPGQGGIWRIVPNVPFPTLTPTPTSTPNPTDNAADNWNDYE